MVVRYSTGKKKLAEFEQLHARALESLTAGRDRALALADRDADAYARLNALQKLPEDDAQRRAEWEGAVREAIGVPKSCFDLSLDLLRLCEELAGRSNEWLRSDLAIAAIAGEAAAASAAWNVRINLPLMTDPSERNRLTSGIYAGLLEARRIRDAVEHACA